MTLHPLPLHSLLSLSERNHIGGNFHVKAACFTRGKGIKTTATTVAAGWRRGRGVAGACVCMGICLLLAAIPRATAFRLPAVPRWAPRILWPRQDRRCVGRAVTMSSGNEGDVGTGGELLFIYGSLMSERVLSALLHRVPQVQPALLRGFHRFRIRDRPYPAIAPVAADFSASDDSVVGGEVPGLVLCGLSPEEHALLDYFEDDEYVKQQVQVQLCRKPHKVATPGYLPQDTQTLEGTSVCASAYVFAQPTSELYGHWHIDKFLSSNVLPSYIEMSDLCRQEYFDTATAPPLLPQPSP